VPSPAAEADFLTLLNAKVKFNTFFLEQEEEFVIRQRAGAPACRLRWLINQRLFLCFFVIYLDPACPLCPHVMGMADNNVLILDLLLQELQERIQWAAEAKPSSAAHAEIARIQCEVVDFHGQMVLLLNYSSINYRPRQDPQEVRQAHGGVLRLPVITGVLQQPFFTTDLISEIVRDCEAMMEAVFPATATAAVFAASRDLEERQALAAAEQGQLHHRRLLAVSHIGGHFSLLELARARLAAAWGWSAAGVVLLQLAGGGSAARMTTS
jgi:hypothetical protein